MSLTGAESHEMTGRSGAVDGMRREWNFSLTFAHQAARVVMQLSPQWESTFIDPREIEQLNRLDRDVKHCPMMPALRYTDLAAVMKPDNELWTEIPKRVSVLYSHIPPDMTLAAYCIRSVQHVLSDSHVVSVDGSNDLTHLCVGDKLRCPHRLGGHRSFHFRYHVSVKSKLIKDVVYAIGTIIHQRGYLCTVQCSEEEELEGYIVNNFLPQYTNPDKFAVDQDVAYEEMTSAILREQQELFGELRYFDADAAVAFSIPMHPMRIRPDFSPTQTVGVGSIACMTLELDVHQKLIDDFAEADITGMPKYKINPVILFLDVEDVARMGYPRIMSMEQYSQLKTNRLLDIFEDAKIVGTPVTNYMGIRTGRSRTVMFTYEPFNAVVKAMTVSSIVGSFGVSAVFLTKLGGGLFDAHLYLYQQLLKGITFSEKTAAKMLFSRFNTVNVRLVEQNIPRVYSNAPVDERQTMEQHLKFLRDSSDGRVEGAVAIPVLPEEGGLEKRHHHPHHPHHRSHDHQHSQREQAETSGENAAPHISLESSGSQAGLLRSSDSIPERRFSDGQDDDYEELSVESDGPSSSCLDGSFHSNSVISVTSIPHLQDAAPYYSVADDVANETSNTNNTNNNNNNNNNEDEAEEDNGSPLPHNSSSAVLTPTSGAETTADWPSTPPVNRNMPDTSAPSLSETGETMAVPPMDRHLGPRCSVVSIITGRAESLAADASAVTISEQQQVEREEEQQRLLREALKEEEPDVYFGPSLYDVYVRSCDLQHCRPNSYLLKKLPTNPRFTNSVRELDLSCNYLGRSGFVAVLNLIEHLPRLETLYFNDMSLDNVDAENLCEVLERNTTVRAIYLRNNSKITLPSTRFFTRLLRVNKRIHILALEGTRLGDTVIKKLQDDAKKNAVKAVDEEA
ncbi:uncharacterized protein TM35_000271070 [Trypanosoma theileri]|uniref:Uncharacterized protein n=1 Tax=Trypanosoma theileri TaxID=67003 RepID=A0A1X0NP99_9TRYP|nr:uncharacterized protein TM35_000271070 [Trypanosoma theileri]ORC86517.1 hypothetical protein TM35_000271070 [Trypanosoma theileri]